MIVADSTYLVDALLSERVSFDDGGVITPNLAVYEVANAIFVRERILHLSGAGERYLGAFFRAIDASVVELVDLSEGLMRDAYEIAVRNQAAIYDCVFVALCLKTGLRLETRDPAQMKILERERTRLPVSPAKEESRQR